MMRAVFITARACAKLFLLPEALPPGGRIILETAAVASRSGGKVLVVDDHELVRNLIVDVLEVAGFDVLAADSGPAALEIVSAHGDDIGCIVQDMSMPGMSGPETIEKTLEICPEACIIVLSVDDEATVRSQLVSAPIKACLEKPCDTDQLVTLVQQTINAG